jgi:hypothetical protein
LYTRKEIKISGGAMKILFVVDNYMGGAGNIVQLLATEYAKEDDVTVLLTHKTIDKRYECRNVNFVELSADQSRRVYALLRFR